MEKDKILNIPSMNMFNYNWHLLLKFMENEGNPPYSIDGDLNLSFYDDIESLGNLISVGGYLDLRCCPIGSLGKLESVGKYLDLDGSNIMSFGNLKYVGSNLFLVNTPNLNMTQEEIRKQVKIEGVISGKR